MALQGYTFQIVLYMNPQESTIRGNLLLVAPEWQEQVQQSMNWIRQWYAGRIDYDYDPLIEASSFDQQDYQNVKQRLDHVWLCAEPGGMAYLEKAMQEGRIKLEAPASVLAHYGLRSDGTVVDRERFEGAFRLGENCAGVSFPIFQDPVVLLNASQIKMDQQRGMPLFVENILIHELTHSLSLTHAEKMAGLGSASMDDYWDSGEEVYARLNEFRSHFGLDPAKQLTVEEVAQLRRQHMGEMGRFLEQRKALDPTGRFAKGELQPQVHDRLPRVLSAGDLFAHYTDAELVRLLNAVAFRRPLDDLDREHTTEALLSQDRLALKADRSLQEQLERGHGKEFAQKADVKSRSVGYRT